MHGSVTAAALRDGKIAGQTENQTDCSKTGGFPPRACPENNWHVVAGPPDG
jgi:hypothetical protein